MSTGKWAIQIALLGMEIVFLTETDCIVYVLGNRVVVLNRESKPVTQFKSSAANTAHRIQTDGRI